MSKLMILILVSVQAFVFVYHKYEKLGQRQYAKRNLFKVKAENSRLKLKAHLLEKKLTEVSLKSQGHTQYLKDITQYLSDEMKLKNIEKRKMEQKLSGLNKRDQKVTSSLKKLYDVVKVDYQSKIIAKQVKDLNNFLKKHSSGEYVAVEVGNDLCKVYHYIGRKVVSTKIVRQYRQCKYYLDDFQTSRINPDIVANRI